MLLRKKLIIPSSSSRRGEAPIGLSKKKIIVVHIAFLPSLFLGWLLSLFVLIHHHRSIGSELGILNESRPEPLMCQRSHFRARVGPRVVAGRPQGLRGRDRRVHRGGAIYDYNNTSQEPAE